MCSNCLKNWREHADRVDLSTRLEPAKSPTADELERHARRFGPAHVEETADQLGLEVNLDGIEEPKRPRRRRR